MSTTLFHFSNKVPALPPMEARVLSETCINYLQGRGISKETAQRFGVFSCISNFYNKKENKWINNHEGVVFPNSKYTGNIRICSTTIKGFSKYTIPTSDGEKLPHLPYGISSFIVDDETGAPLNNQHNWIFLTESEIDGLSILENDYTIPTLATGGTCGLNRYFQVLQLKGIGIPPFIVGAFDRDNAGVDCYNNLNRLLELNEYKGRVVNFWDYVETIGDDVKDLNDYWVKYSDRFRETLKTITSYKKKSVLRDEVNQFTPVTVTSINRWEEGAPVTSSKVEPVNSEHPTFKDVHEPLSSPLAKTEPTDIDTAKEKDSEETSVQPSMAGDDIEDETATDSKEITDIDIQNLTDGGRRYLEFKRKFGGDNLVEKIRNRQKNPRPVLSTPYTSLNRDMNGGYRTGLHFIGGSTGIGKTFFMLTLCEHFVKNGKDVIYYTYEVDDEIISTRMVSQLSFYEYGEGGYTSDEIMELRRTNPETGRSEYLLNEDINKIDRLLDTFDKEYSGRLNIVDVSSFNVGETPSVDYIFNQVKDYWEQTKETPIVFIDYLQLIQPTPNMINSSDKQIIDSAVRKLKQLATVTGGYIFVVTSLNRESYNSAPSEKSSKETGLIEYMGDSLTILSYSDGSGRKMNSDELSELKHRDDREIYLHSIKNRRGRSGFVITFKNYSKFGVFEDKGYWIKSEPALTTGVDSLREKINNKHRSRR